MTFFCVKNRIDGGSLTAGLASLFTLRQHVQFARIINMFQKVREDTVPSALCILQSNFFFFFCSKNGYKF